MTSHEVTALINLSFSIYVSYHGQVVALKSTLTKIELIYSLKGIIYPNMKILSITHHHVVPNP